jgi:hypothetical protein
LSSSASQIGAGPLTCPKKGSTAEQWRIFLDAFADQKSPKRQEELREMAESDALWVSQHWLQMVPDQQAGRVPRFASLADPSIPQTVNNRVLELQDNEYSKLLRRKSKGKVRTKVSREGEMGAAKVGDEILEHHLKAIKWPQTRARGTFRYIAYGTMLLRSYWKTDYTETIRVGIDGACRCLNQDCGCTYASRDVKPDLAMTLPPGAVSRDDYFNGDEARMTTKFTLERCPQCGAPMKDGYTPTPEEALNSDPFGAPLGEDVAKGNACLESLHNATVYFENEGVGMEPETLGEWVIEEIKSLDWVRANFKHPELDSLKPEDPVVLAERSYYLGEFNQTQDVRSAESRNLYRNHVRVRWYHKKGLRAEDMGRYAIMAGPLLITDTDLAFQTADSKGRKGKELRSKLIIARYWRREGELRGLPMNSVLKSPQRRINMIGSQITDQRERSAKLIVSTAGMKIRQGRALGMTHSHLVIDPDPEYPKGLEIIETKPIDAGVYQELEWNERFMRESVGAQDADTGKQPAAGTPAIRYKLEADQAAIRRLPREEELSEAFKEAFSHQLVLLQQFAREPREFWVKGPGEQWEEKAFQGADLVDQTDIEIEDEASFDEDAYTKEMLLEADNRGLIPKDDPVVVNEVFKVLGLPGSIGERRQRQIEDASRKWAKFKDEGKIPVIEPTQDDHAVFFNFYGKALKDDDGLALKEKAKWDEILPLIAGWDGPTGKLAQAEQMDAQVRQWQAQAQMPPPAPPAPTGDPMADAQAQGAYQSQAQGIGLAQQGLQSIPGGVEAALLPDYIADRIATVWTRILQAKMYPVTPEQITFLRFEAAVESHGLLLEREAQAAMAGQAVAAAPGAQAAPVA